MYVDKKLSGIKVVQTLSRLNRAHPSKYDTFVLDFSNDSDTIKESFADFYRTTLLSEETDPNKLHDLQGDLDRAQVYSREQIDDLVTKYISGASRDRLDPILDQCVAIYQADLDEDNQVDFKSKAKTFVRTYGFLSSILPYMVDLLSDHTELFKQFSDNPSFKKTKQDDFIPPPLKTNSLFHDAFSD